MTKCLTCLLGMVLAVGIVLAPSARAQGLQTGTLSGVVKDPDNLPVPGASITVTSAALQGERTTVTDEIGAYLIRGLPPGTYTVRFELPGAATVEQAVEVPLGGVAKVDPILQLAGVQEAVIVTARVTPPPLAATQQSTNLRVELIEALPIGRRPFEIAELAPGVTDNTPNVGQMAIGGAFAFDSIFLIDGVDANDNLFGYSNNLFIEEAIQETQVVTSGISAEYGRFGGGVVNVITKSGGDIFSGSFRTNLSRPSWTEETPFETERNIRRSDMLSKFYEFTVGGPILRDRLWFFNAGRYEDSVTGRTLAEVGTAYDNGVNNKRFEVKLTGTTPGYQRFSGTFVNNPTDQSNQPSINAALAMDPAVLLNARLPNHLWGVNWNGVLTNQLFGTFQWSRKQWSRHAGGTSTDIRDSPFLSRGTTGVPVNRHYNAPYFSELDPEERNNRQYTGSLSYFLTDSTFGRHDLKGGFEQFTSIQNGGNSQSATGYVFQTDYQRGADGRPIVDSAGHPSPIWGGNAAAPAAAATRVQKWTATRGATLEIKTVSLYLQDRWTAADRLTVDLGVRYEKVRSEATGDIVGADTDTVVPRLGITFDVEGNGRTVAQATFGRYSGRFTERAFGRNTNVASPSLVTLAYTGPNGVGRDFAPGFDLNNYTVVGGNFPTANVFFDDNLTSPKTTEFALSLGTQFVQTGHAKAIYVWRKTSDFIEDFIDDPTAAGRITVVRDSVNFGTFDRVLWKNTDAPRREYQALQFQSRVQVLGRLPVEGHWTIQIRNHGNFEGEATNQPGIGSIWFDYPEFFSEDRYYPYGRLDEFQRHKVRLWTTYNQRVGRFGSVDISPIWRIDSGLTYSLAAAGVPLSAVQLARDPGYARGRTTTATLFFDERGSESFKGYGLLDVALRYGVPVWQSVQPWVQVSIFNVFDNQKLVQWDTSVTRDLTSPVDTLGQPTEFVRGTNFGKGTAASHYPPWSTGDTGGRTFRLAFGVRF